MAKRGVKSTMLSNVPPELRAKVDADIITVIEHPGTGDDSRPRDYDDVYRWHELETLGVSIHALKRYARGVEARHLLSLRAAVAEAVAGERSDLVPAARNLFAARILDHAMDGGNMDVETLSSLSALIDRFRRTELAEAESRRKETETTLRGLNSNDSLRAFVRACEETLGATWTDQRDAVLARMNELLKGSET